MEFRNLKRQYQYLKKDIDDSIGEVIQEASFIGGKQITKLEKSLAEYTGQKYCISCANGTDALQLALMAWNIGDGDAVLVPDFTFFSTGEVVSAVGATPIFVDVRPDTFNLDISSLKFMIEKVKSECRFKLRAIIAVDLFGQPAEYYQIKQIASEYGLYLLEDAAQGFGGSIAGEKTCSFGDISTTSFFPAKPLGCYGDGGAVFTNNDEWAEIIQSLKVHGKGDNKYDNIRIGMNSRLDSIQAAILNAKLPAFINNELPRAQMVAERYMNKLRDYVKTPVVLDGYSSSWAQYTIQLESINQRNGLQEYLRDNKIPSMVYYQKPMHRQTAFENNGVNYDDSLYCETNKLCETVLSLPFDPYIENEDIDYICDCIKCFILR